MFFVSMSHYCRCPFASHVLQGMLSLGHNVSVSSTSRTVTQCGHTVSVPPTNKELH